MYCKFCQSEMNEDELVCPNCGKSQEDPIEEICEPAAEPAVEKPAEPEAKPEAEPDMKPGIQVSTGKLAAFVLLCVVVFGVVVALMLNWLGGGAKEPAETTLPATEATEIIVEETVVYTTPADGNPEDVTCKGTYTVSDEEAIAANATVVATVGSHSLTNGQLQPYYWGAVVNFLNNYGSYISYFGLDVYQGLDVQACLFYEEGENKTWQHYFLETALQDWHRDVALVEESEKTGFQISEADQADLDLIPANLDEAAAQAGAASTEELIQGVAGKGSILQDYVDYLTLNNLAYFYYEHCCDQIEITEEDLEAYFAEHETAYAESGLTKESLSMSVRHILLEPANGVTDETGYYMTYSDEDWAACEAQAQALLDQWKAGEATEDSFAALANEHSIDGDSNTNGGLYEGLTADTNFVEEFKAWYMDESRQPGDTGLVKSVYGYHIMYFSGSELEWKNVVREELLAELTNAIIPAAMEQYTIDVDYSAIVLGYVSLV